MSDGYWPWWAGALVLGSLAPALWWIERRPFGVSGAMGRLVTWMTTRTSRESERLLSDEEALAQALLAATQDQFGPPSHPPPAILVPIKPHLPTAFAVMIACIVIGGGLGALSRGNWNVHWDLPALVGGHRGAIASLVMVVVGGLLSGFGTRLAGGCTSGHGLTGCGSLRPASMLAVGCFLTSAIGLSWLMDRVVGP